MRIWSIHPKFLDAKGLVALWRETLLARKVVEGNTKGYRNHPQLIRFLEKADPLAYLNCYLHEVWKEAKRRGYHFSKDKLQPAVCHGKMPLPRGQFEYEKEHLMRKLEQRSPKWLQKIHDAQLDCHPLFQLTEGGIAPWEKTF